MKALSLIPWATDEATSYRALTQPPPPLPSLRLQAQPPVEGPPTDWVEQAKWADKPRSQTGFLGSHKLTRKALAQWTRRLANECGVKLEVLRKGSPILAYMDKYKKQGGFQASTKAIYLRPGPTQYEIAHEAMHAEQWRKLGAEQYSQQTRLEKETYVYEKLMEKKNKLTSQEVKHARAYINDIRKENGLEPLIN